MRTGPRLVILGCTSFSTGEMTLALDWVRQSQQRFDLHAIVGTPLANAVRASGATVHTYPAMGQLHALRTIRTHLDRLRPDILLLADLLHFYGVSGEFGTLLMPVLDQLRDCRVIGLDLYDLESNGGLVDLFGRRAHSPVLVSRVGRLMPSPYLAPARSTPGRGRYAMMRDGEPVSDAAQREARQALSLPDAPVVLLTTSPWQHLTADYVESARVTRHFPALMLRILNEAAARTRDVTLLHLGPRPLGVPPDVPHVNYRHIPQLAPPEFLQVLQSTDLVLSPNCIASTSIRAASMRIPVAMLHLGRAVATAPAQIPAGSLERAVHQFLADAAPTYASSVWPLGFHALMSRLLTDNPFRGIQDHLDALDAPPAAAHLASLLAGGEAVDDLRQRQSAYFSLLANVMDTPDQALEAAMQTEDV